MKHRFVRHSAALLIVDVQERLAAAMAPQKLKQLMLRTMAAVDGAKALGLPIIVTEQYSKGLGPTLKPIAQKVGEGFTPIEKLEFSALVEPVRQRLAGRSQVLVVGMETHVCIFQTVRALTDAGLSPYVAVDAVLSRHEPDFTVGLELCRDAGARLTTVEAALFDAMGRAGGPEFKAVSAAVK
jgi:nicotinamidase-related amidase